MRVDNIEELGPFRRRPGVGHVPGDEDEIERPLGVNFGETLKSRSQPPVAAGPGAAALDAKTVALADDVDVREMRDPPHARAGRRVVERCKIERLVGRGVGKAPDERSGREISRHQGDRVGDRRRDQEVRRQDIGDRA